MRQNIWSASISSKWEFSFVHSLLLLLFCKPYYKARSKECHIIQYLKDHSWHKALPGSHKQHTSTLKWFHIQSVLELLSLLLPDFGLFFTFVSFCFFFSSCAIKNTLLAWSINNEQRTYRMFYTLYKRFVNKIYSRSINHLLEERSNFERSKTSKHLMETKTVNNSQLSVFFRKKKKSTVFIGFGMFSTHNPLSYGSQSKENCRFYSCAFGHVFPF